MRPALRVVPDLNQHLDVLRGSLKHDSSPRNTMRVAEALWMSGRPEAAITLLEPLVLDFPSSISSRLLLGWCLEDLGRTNESQVAFREARQLDPANPFLREDLAAGPPVGQIAEGQLELPAEHRGAIERSLEDTAPAFAEEAAPVMFEDTAPAIADEVAPATFEHTAPANADEAAPEMSEGNETMIWDIEIPALESSSPFPDSAAPSAIQTPLADEGTPAAILEIERFPHVDPSSLSNSTVIDTSVFETPATDVPVVPTMAVHEEEVRDPSPRMAPRYDGEREAEPEAALTPEELRAIPPSPLYSATLGEIFERQGFEEKAIEIYREVLRQHPDRSDLAEKIAMLESRLAEDSGR